MDDVAEAMLEARPDRILNLAYLLGAGEDDPHLAVRLNVLGMDNCFEAARLCGIRRVVYASSLAVYGQGLGRALLLRAFELAKERGCDRLTLESGRSREVAHHIYRSAGMTEEGFFFGIEW